MSRYVRCYNKLYAKHQVDLFTDHRFNIMQSVSYTFKRYFNNYSTLKGVQFQISTFACNKYVNRVRSVAKFSHISWYALNFVEPK